MRTATQPGNPAQCLKATFPRALASEALRLYRSPLVLLHAVCAVGVGSASGAYFAYAPWDPSMGLDAFVQLLGAMMPLMVGLVCGIDADAEIEATGLSNLLSAPSRQRALAARISSLWLMGATALGLAVSLFAAILAFGGKAVLEPAAYAASVAGLGLGSVPMYLISYAIALRWGRNVAISAGAIGLVLAFFSIGGLAHGLMTGQLTTAQANSFALLPTSWAVVLGSLPVEISIAAGSADPSAAFRIADRLVEAVCLCTTASALLSIILSLWISRFEPAQHES